MDRQPQMGTDKHELVTTPDLFSEIRSLIEASRQKVAVAVNAEITMLYWHIGKRISQEILQGKRGAEYGKQIVAALSGQLTEEYGRGWSEKQLRHCLHFVETFPDNKIVSTLWRQLNTNCIRLLNGRNRDCLKMVVNDE